jgi:hypothetical protein
VPIRAHALALEVREGSPEPRRAPRQQQKPPQRSQHQRPPRAKTSDRSPEAPARDGPRRDRKGNEVWSNSGPPRRRTGR